MYFGIVRQVHATRGMAFGAIVDNAAEGLMEGIA